MSNTSTSVPVTTGSKRKRSPTYDELKDEVKELKAKLKESRDQYNAVVPIYSNLWRQVEQAKQDYRELADKQQELILNNNTLRSISFFGD